MPPLLESVMQPLRRDVAADEGPAPSAAQTFGSGFIVGVNDAPVPKDLRISHNYFDLMRSVGDINGKGLGDYRPWSKTLNQFVPFSSHLDVYDLDLLWQDIAEIQRRNPKALPGITTRDAYEGKEARGSAGVQEARVALSRGNPIVGFAGQVAAAPFDPSNWLGLGATAKTLVGAIGVAATENAVIEAATERLKRQQAAMAGEERGLRDLVWDTGVAAGGGAIIGGGGRAIGDNWAAIKSAPVAVQEKVWAQILMKAPPSLRDKLAGKMDWDALDDALPDLAEAVVGRENMSIAEKAAVDMMRREGEVDAVNPYRPDGAGTEAHRMRMQQALADVDDFVAGARRRAARRVAARGGGGSGETALSSGTVAAPEPATGARATIKTKIGRAESPNDTAKNPRSSATGRYQFVSGTWLAYYKRRYGSQGLTDAQILAKRTDGNVQEVLMDDLLADNSRFLRAQGQAESAGNLYLTHFAGQGGARRLFAAEPGARAIDVLGADVVRANPFLKDMTAADVIAWAHRKMDEPAPMRSGTGAVEGYPDAAARARLAERGEAITADRAAAEDAMRAAAPDRTMFEPDAMPMPELSRDLFPDEVSWSVAQSAQDAEVLGLPQPVVTRATIWDDAREDLIAARAAEVPGALFHPDVGPITVAAGARSVGDVPATGLARIADELPDLVESLPATIDAMEVSSATANRIVLRSHDEKVTARIERAAPDAPWTLTSVSRKGKAPVAPQRAAAVRQTLRTDGEAATVARAANDYDAPGAALYDAPIGEGAKLDIMALRHDLKAAIDAEELGGVGFTVRDGTAENAADVLASIEAEEAALAALRACL